MLASLVLLNLMGASPLYVQASRLNVRKAPDAKSKIVAKLAVGMKVDVLERKSDFVRIQRKKVSGWASAALLTDKPVRLNDLLIKFEAAQTLEEKRRWIERAAALAPRSSEVLEHLVATLEKIGDTKALAQARLGLAAAAGKPSHNIHLVHLGEFPSEYVSLVVGTYSALAIKQDGLHEATLVVKKTKDPTESDMPFVSITHVSGAKTKRYIVDQRPKSKRMKPGLHARRLPTPKLNKKNLKARLDVKGQNANLRFIKREAVETEPGARIQHTVYAIQIGKKWHNFSSYGSELWLADFDGDGQIDVLTDLAHHYAVIFDEELWLSSLSSKSLIDKAAVARNTAM